MGLLLPTKPKKESLKTLEKNLDEESLNILAELSEKPSIGQKLKANQLLLKAMM